VAAADVIVHLAGENLFGKRWSDAQKKRLVESRVETTTRLAQLAAQRRPAAFLSASAVGYYGPSERQNLDETAPAQDAQVAARVLEIALTSRGDGLPLAGVPVKAAAE